MDKVEQFQQEVLALIPVLSEKYQWYDNPTELEEWEVTDLVKILENYKESIDKYIEYLKEYQHIYDDDKAVLINYLSSFLLYLSMDTLY